MRHMFNQIKKSLKFSSRILFLKGVTGIEGSGNPKTIWEIFYEVSVSVDPITYVLFGVAGMAAYAAYRYFRYPRLDIPDSSVSNIVYERTPAFKQGFHFNDPYHNISFTAEETILLQKFNLNGMFKKGAKIPSTDKSIISDLLEENALYQALDSGQDINWSDKGAITQSYLFSIKDYYFMLNPTATYTHELARKIAHLADLCTELLLLLHTYG